MSLRALPDLPMYHSVNFVSNETAKGSFNGGEIDTIVRALEDGIKELGADFKVVSRSYEYLVCPGELIDGCVVPASCKKDLLDADPDCIVTRGYIEIAPPKQG